MPWGQVNRTAFELAYVEFAEHTQASVFNNSGFRFPNCSDLDIQVRPGLAMPPRPPLLHSRQW